MSLHLTGTLLGLPKAQGGRADRIRGGGEWAHFFRSVAGSEWSVFFFEVDVDGSFRADDLLL